MAAAEAQAAEAQPVAAAADEAPVTHRPRRPPRPPMYLRIQTPLTLTAPPSDSDAALEEDLRQMTRRSRHQQDR